MNLDKTMLKMGNPALLQRSQEVTDFDPQVLNPIILAMREVKERLQGVGIAAPQIGIFKRIVLLGFEHNPRYPNESPIPEMVLINPRYEPINDEKVSLWEGCLSVPTLRGYVERFLNVKFTGYDIGGTLIEREASGFHARIIQHECDHLDGILYPRRLKDLRLFGFEDDLKTGDHLQQLIELARNKAFD